MMHAYVQGVDIWSIGCIFAELLTHDAFFQGEHPQHQLEIIVSKLGMMFCELFYFETVNAF